MNKTVLRVRNLEKSFENKQILKNVNFSVKESQIIGISGPSGCGKSTLLNCLAGIVQKDRGEIYFKGELIDILKLKEHVGFSFQKNSFYMDLSSKQNMHFFAVQDGLHSSVMKERTKKLLNLVDLSDFKNIPASKLSGGMQKRLDLAIGLLEEPALIFLDEPFNGLDKEVRNHIWSLIHELKRKNMSVFVISHFLDELEENADYFLEMSKHGTVSEGTYLKKIGYWTLQIIFSEPVEFMVQGKKMLNKNFLGYYSTRKNAMTALKKINESKYSTFIKRVKIFQKNSNEKIEEK